MSDKEKLKALLDEWGVPYKEDVETDFTTGTPVQVILFGDFFDQHNNSGKITGYGGFYTAFEFDFNGQFLKVGAWE